MNSILKRLHQLGDEDLRILSESIDIELDCRLERADALPESARRRAIDRQSSYRHSNGAAALPVRVIGLRPAPRRRLAA